MAYIITLVYTQGYSKHVSPVWMIARSSQWLSTEVCNISKQQDRKCLSNSCLTFHLSGNECIKYIYASNDPEKETEAKDSKVTKQMRFCCFMNILVSCVFCLYNYITNWYKLNLLFPSAKCSGQPTAGAEQMFTSEQLRLESVYSKLLKEFSETIWSIFSDFVKYFIAM